jgi:hypothetical protein
MMLSSTAGKQNELTDTQELARKKGGLVSKKIWLPKLIYDALPYFYLVAGISAFFTTLYISEWFWVLPHYLLFSAACVHLGIIVYRRRNRKVDAEA